LLEAKQMLEVVKRRHEHEHDWAMGIDASVLYVLTLEKLGQRQSALLELGKIVRLCVPNGLIGPFIEQNQALKPLLLELGKEPDYAQLVLLLLTSFPRQQAMIVAIRSSEDLVEPLTERELEILRLLADRLSNKEIALRLVVSANTVRNHTANIFSKLQVENRFQAVKRAQTVGLLPASKRDHL
jgi:LuxR family maltose regulon positive regulatory protein